MPVEDVRRAFHALVLAGGATQARDLQVPGRDLQGIHLAVEYLTQQNRICEGDVVPGRAIDLGSRKARGHRRRRHWRRLSRHRPSSRRISVHQFELLPRPPERAPDNPWPQWPHVFRVSSAHEEGGERVYAVSTERFTGDKHGQVRAVHVVEVRMTREAVRVAFTAIPATQFELEADLVLLAMGLSDLSATASCRTSACG